VPFNSKEAILIAKLLGQVKEDVLDAKGLLYWLRYCWIKVKSQNYHFIKEKPWNYHIFQNNVLNGGY